MIDINKLGREFEIYTTVDYIGRGFPIILPRGARMIRTLRNYVEKEEENQGYKVVRTPSISNSEVYKKEDRYELQKNRLFVIKNFDEENKNEIVLKPYVQPFHCSIYKENQHSYKELPIKYCETSTVFRKEKDVKGILKTRQITMSDASIFCEPDKIEKSIKDAIRIQQKYIKKLDLEVKYIVSTWDDTNKENYIGKIDEWNSVVQAMKNSLDDLEIKYVVDNNARIYGPSIRIIHNDKDFLRTQVDFEIPHRFDLKYTDKTNIERFPMYIHHTIVGSYEQLMAMLIERYQGDFPLWIAPDQVEIICSNADYENFAKEVKDQLVNNGIRAEIDNSIGSSQNRLKKQQKLKVPYIVLIGKEEYDSNTLKVVKSDGTKKYNLDDLIWEVKECLSQF